MVLCYILASLIIVAFAVVMFMLSIQVFSLLKLINFLTEENKCVRFTFYALLFVLVAVYINGIVVMCLGLWGFPALGMTLTSSNENIGCVKYFAQYSGALNTMTAWSQIVTTYSPIIWSTVIFYTLMGLSFRVNKKEERIENRVEDN